MIRVQAGISPEQTLGCFWTERLKGGVRTAWGEQARQMWQDMRADLPQDSPWHGVIVAAIENEGTDASPGAEAEAIETMVAGLAARLEANANDVDGWQQLIRSYMVLERPQDAQAALDRARAAFGPGSPEAGHLVAYGLSLGLEVEQ